MIRQTFALAITCPVCFGLIDVEAIITVDRGDASSPPDTDVDLGLESSARCPLCNASWTGLELEAMEDQALIASGAHADRLADGDPGRDTLDWEER